MEVRVRVTLASVVWHGGASAHEAVKAPEAAVRDPTLDLSAAHLAVEAAVIVFELLSEVMW